MSELGDGRQYHATILGPDILAVQRALAGSTPGDVPDEVDRHIEENGDGMPSGATPRYWAAARMGHSSLDGTGAIFADPDDIPRPPHDPNIDPTYQQPQQPEPGEQ